jgi:hypothetical protein
MTDRHSLELFGIWFGFLVGTILWILISLSGVPLSLFLVPSSCSQRWCSPSGPL